MTGVQIVVDSAADLDADAIEALGIRVVPWSVQIDGTTLPDGPALRTAEFYHRAFRVRQSITVTPPAVHQFSNVLEECSRTGSEVIAILSASRITRAMDMARRARAEYMGRCDVHLVDSQFISCLQGAMAIEAAQEAQAGLDAVEILRHINGMMSRSYWAFTVETPDQLLKHSLVENTPTVLGTPTGYRPLLLLEEGEITPLVRSRRRGEPVERLVEFAAEFLHLQQLWLVSTGLHPGLQTLHERMAEMLPEQPYTDHIYGPVVASYFGPTLLGVAALESA